MKVAGASGQAGAQTQNFVSRILERRRLTFAPSSGATERSCMQAEQTLLLANAANDTQGSDEEFLLGTPSSDALRKQFAAPTLSRTKSHLTVSSPSRANLSEVEVKNMSAFGRVASIPEASLDPATPSSDAWVSLDAVMFLEKKYYGMEGEDKEIEIEVIRCGECKDQVSVDYYTMDDSAKAGVRFVDSCGTLRFEPGVRIMKIFVKIVDDSLFHPTAEFTIRLTQPRGCYIHEAGSVCTACIIDDDLFPSTAGAQVASGNKRCDVDLHSYFVLFTEYIKRNLRDENIRWRTAGTVLLDIIDNVATMLNLVVQLYIIDILFSHTPEAHRQLFFNHSRHKTGLALSVVMLVPMALRFFADSFRIMLDLEGHAMMFLRKGLFYKHVSWSPASRALVGKAEFAHALLHDPREIVSHGYLTFLTGGRLINKLLLIMLIGIFYQGSWPLMIPGFLLTAAAVGYSSFSIPKLAGLTAEYGEREGVFIHDTDECDANIDLVQDYQIPWQMGQAIEQTSDELRKTHRSVDFLEKNAVYVFSWVGAIVAAASVFGTSVYCAISDVCDDESFSAGEIITMVTVSRDLASDFRDIFSCITSLMKAIATLHNYTRMMNLPTDLQQVRALTLRRKHEMHKQVNRIYAERLPATAGKTEQTWAALDNIPFSLLGADFESVRIPTRVRLHIPHLEIPAGALTCVLGTQGHGKRNLLQALAGRRFAKHGLVFVASHLEVLYISDTPLIFQQSLWFNLTLGREKSDPALIRKVLEQVQWDSLLHLFDEEERSNFEDIYVQDGIPWYSILQATDLAMVNFARGFCKDPHVLLIASPHTHVPRVNHDLIDASMRAFVRERGIYHNQELCARRKRTCLFTSHFPQEAIDVSDFVLKIKDEELLMETGGFMEKGRFETSVSEPLGPTGTPPHRHADGGAASFNALLDTEAQADTVPRRRHPYGGAASLQDLLDTEAEADTVPRHRHPYGGAAPLQAPLDTEAKGGEFSGHVRDPYPSNDFLQSLVDRDSDSLAH